MIHLYIWNRRLNKHHNSTGVFKEEEEEDPKFMPGIEAGLLEHLARNRDTVLTGYVCLCTKLYNT